MDTRFGNMLLHCSTTYIHVSIREYDGVVDCLSIALSRHTRSEERAIWYPLFYIEQFMKLRNGYPRSRV